MRLHGLLIASFFLLGIPLAGAQPGPMTPPPGAACPMTISGTKVAYADAEGGGALTFTTQGDLAALRARVKAMAAAHEQRCAQMQAMPRGNGAGRPGPRGRGMGMGPGARFDWRMPLSTATAEDVPGGVKLVIKAKDPAQTQAVRDAVKRRADVMAQGHCPMMPAAAQTPSGR